MDEETNTGIAGQIPVRYKIVMVAVAIAVVTVLAVWLVPDDKQPTPPPLPELPSSAPQRDVDPTPPATPAEDSTAVIRAGNRARAFISSLRRERSEPDPDTVFGEAERLQGEGYTDDAYLLYRFAARHGHGQAALVLGFQSDPAANADALSDEPEQAYKWYAMAVAAGIEEATAHLQDLRKRVEQSAAEGDERAQRLMLQWQ